MKIPVPKTKVVQEYTDVELPIYFKKDSKYYKVFGVDNKPYVMTLYSYIDKAMPNVPKMPGVYTKDFESLMEHEQEEVERFLNKGLYCGESISEEHFNKVLRDCASQFHDFLNYHLRHPRHARPRQMTTARARLLSTDEVPSA